MVVDQRHAATSGLSRCDYRLELALLAFMDKLKVGLLYVETAVGEDKTEETSGEIAALIERWSDSQVDCYST
eukprot:2418007-Rhodomonas_salina.1